MTVFLLLIIAVLIGLLVWRGRAMRREWRRVARMVALINKGERPSSFILHGDEAFRSIGLGLEALADERERMLRQLSQEEFNLQAILSGISEGVMVVDTARRVRLVNPALMQAFELANTPLGQSVLQTVRNASVESMIRTALDTGRSDAREVHLQRSGSYFAASAAPIRDRTGQLLGAVAIFHDITRVRQLEQVRRDFVSNVSHELRTPLAIFQGYVELLLDHEDLPLEERVRTFHILQKHSQRLNLLVEDLLALARLESRNVEFKLSPVSVHDLIASVAEDWELKFQQKQVQLRRELPPQPLTVMGEMLRLEQVLGNLMANALRFTPEGGTVALEVEAQDGEVEIRIRDSGCGIPAADLPHVFERFYRADKARTRENENASGHASGTGLGLSIVKHIIMGHGGSVRAESVYERGTVILIRLPLAPPSSAT